jgi:hypothetical protein
MKLRGRSPRVTLAVLAALLAALLVSACGGSSGSGGSSKSASSRNAAATTTNSSTSKTASAARTAFTTCLKQHGVTAASGFGGGFGGRRNRTGTGTIPKITANGTNTTQSGSGAPGGGFPGGGGAGGAANGAPNGGGFPGGGGGAGFAGGNSKFAKAFQACRSKLGNAGFGAGRFQGRPGAGTARPHFSTTALKSYVSCIRKNGYAAMPEPKAGASGSFFPASVEKNAKFQAANKKCESILLKAFRRPAAGAGAGGGSYTITGTSTTSST